jgi:ATP-binding cassette subfamily E protein 1
LEAADVIKKVTELTRVPCFVVDHDVLFIDSVSDGVILFEGEPGKNGFANAPASLKQGMHDFLEDMNVSMRRDKDSGRPRINKLGSALDREQKQSGNLYYVE